MSDLLKDLERLQASLDKYPEVFSPTVNPENAAPIRAARSAEQSAELLQAMIDSSEKESAERKKHDRALLWISIATLIASLIGAAAAVYQIFD